MKKRKKKSSSRSSKKNALFSKLKKRAEKAFDQKKTEEVREAAGALPAGLKGVAKLTSMEFGTYDSGGKLNGEAYWGAQGIIVSPQKFKGMKVAGRTTRISEPLCDTPDWNGAKTLEDHLGNVTNSLKLLGMEIDDLPFDELEEACEEYCEEEVYFEFSVVGSKKKDSDRVYENWGAVVEDFDPDEIDDDDDDDDDEESDIDPADLKKLARKADKEDEDAQEQLQEIGEDYDLDSDDYDSWKKFAEAIIENLEDEEDDEEEYEEEDDE